MLIATLQMELDYATMAHNSSGSRVTTAAQPPLPMEDCTPLLQLLKDLRLANPDATSREFVAHLRTKLSVADYASCYTLSGWRRLLQLGEDCHLLNFFASVYVDFNDYPLDRLLERWHRLWSLAGGADWTDNIVEQFVANLNGHFASHLDHRCRQQIGREHVLFLYRRFGVVPSAVKFLEAATEMIACIEWVSRNFDGLFVRFMTPPSLLLANVCCLCCNRQRTLSAHLTTVCPLTGHQLVHQVELCEQCSALIRHTLMRCPCCQRTIVKAKHSLAL